MTTLAEACSDNAMNWPTALTTIAGIAAVAFVMWVIFR